jgi:hypothetical protein
LVNHGLTEQQRLSTGNLWTVARTKAEHGIDKPAVSRWDDWTNEENAEAVAAYRERLRLGPRRKAIGMGLRTIPVSIAGLFVTPLKLPAGG